MNRFNLSPCKYLQLGFCLAAPLLFVGCNSSTPPGASAAPPRAVASPKIIATPAPVPKSAFVIPDSPLPKSNSYYALVKAAQTLQPELPANSTRTQQKAHAQKNAAALTAARQALQLPIVAPPQRGIVATKLYHAPLRNLARAFTEQARVQADAGNFNAAVNSGLDAIEMGAAIQNGSGQITMLVGVAIEQIGRRELWKWRENLTAAQATQAARRLEQIEAKRSSLVAMESAEKWQALSTLRQLFGEADWKKFRDGQPSSWDTMFKNPDDMARLRKVSQSQIEANSVAKLDAAIARSQAPYAPYAPNLPPLAQAADPLSNLLTGSAASPQMRIAYENNRAENRLLMTAFALQAFVKNNRGRALRNLNELVPKYLKVMPRDPFAPTKPLSYGQIAGDYDLYSVGPDGKDNGGAPIKTRGIGPDSVGDIMVGFGDLR